MQPLDTLTSRSDAASVVSVRTRGRTPRSVRVSNATDRILRDDPAWLKGWGATQASRLALGHPLPTSVEGSGLRVQRPSEARRSLTVKPLMSGFTLANNSRNLVARGLQRVASLRRALYTVRTKSFRFRLFYTPGTDS
jgi:hypothetical protein